MKRIIPSNEFFKRCMKNPRIRTMFEKTLEEIESTVEAMISANNELYSYKLDISGIINFYRHAFREYGIGVVDQEGLERFFIKGVFPVIENTINEEIENTTHSYEKIVAFCFKDASEAIIAYGNRCLVKAEKLAFENFGFAMYSR